MERITFITGRLAERGLRATLATMQPEFEYSVAVLPISVAALMTTSWIAERLTLHEGTTRAMIPGLCEGELRTLEDRLGVAVVRGPKDLKDIPGYFGRPQERPGYGAYNIKIVAEIHNAPDLDRDGLLARAEYYRRSGADIIDLGCHVERRWSGVGEAVALLKDHGFAVSVDSFDRQEILAADEAGADLILSLNGTNLDLADRLHARVVVVPDADGEMESLVRNVAAVDRTGLRYVIDPIINPLNFGFAESLRRLLAIRDRWPSADVMIGTHHITELLDADSVGVNALLIGLAEELGVRYVLTTEVAHWARGSVRELSVARELSAHSHARGMLPKHLEERLLVAKDRQVTRYTTEELRDLQQQIRDPNYRIFLAEGQICVFNAEQFVQGTDIRRIFERLDVDEPSHAFYLGKELMKARLALALDKSYMQEQELDWGYLTPPAEPRSRTRLTQRFSRSIRRHRKGSGDAPT
jgi:dihydropteroate synthase